MIRPQIGDFTATPARQTRARGPEPSGPEQPEQPGQPARRPGRGGARSPAPEPDGPHVRLGIAWALVSVVALIAGPMWVAVWLAPAAGLAAGSAVRSWQGGRAGSDDKPAGSRSRLGSVQPPVPLAAAAAALVTVAAAVGPLPAVAAAVFVVCGIVAGAAFGPLGRPDVARRAAIVLLPALAAGGLILSRAQSTASGGALLAMACAYDSAAYLIGTDAKYSWEGPLAGLASIAALTILIAAILAPPFRGDSPWILGCLAAVSAPLGPVVARYLVKDPSARVPALRRLDTLLLLGPVWAVAAAVLAHI